MVDAFTAPEISVFAGGGGAHAIAAMVTAFNEVNLAVKSKSTPDSTSPNIRPFSVRKS